MNVRPDPHSREEPVDSFVVRRRSPAIQYLSCGRPERHLGSLSWFKIVRDEVSGFMSQSEALLFLGIRPVNEDDPVIAKGDEAPTQRTVVNSTPYSDTTPFKRTVDYRDRQWPVF
jgi:hypothetical protein